jgi:hypothetical protein
VRRATHRSTSPAPSIPIPTAAQAATSSPVKGSVFDDDASPAVVVEALVALVVVVDELATSVGDELDGDEVVDGGVDGVEDGCGVPDFGVVG